MKSLLSYSKTIFTIALPVTFQSLVEYAFFFTDMAFIGQYDPAGGLSAINNVIQPFFVLFSFLMAITQGVTIVVSQRIGAKRPLTARRFAETALFFNVLISLCYLAFWTTMGSHVLAAVGARGAILERGTAFVTILSLQFITTGLGFTAGALFQAIGNTKPVMVVAIGKCLLNIALDWIFIFGHLGLPQMGLPGAALANAISAVLGDVFLFGLLLKLRVLKIRIKRILKPVPALFGKILGLGIPVGLEYILWTIGQVFLVAMANGYDQTTSGFFGMFNMLIQLSMSLYNGIGVAGMVLVGQATGAKNPREALMAANYSIFFSQAMSAVVMVVLILFPESVIRLFGQSAETAARLAPFLQFFSLSMFVKALNIIAGNSIRGTGNTVWMMGTQVAGTIIITGVCWFLLSTTEMRLMALLIAVVVDETIRAGLNAVKFYRAQYRAIRRRDAELAPEANAA